jgi:hypothetical protein
MNTDKATLDQTVTEYLGLLPQMVHLSVKQALGVEAVRRSIPLRKLIVSSIGERGLDLIIRWSRDRKRQSSGTQ